jgi:hypothetical protein
MQRDIRTAALATAMVAAASLAAFVETTVLRAGPEPHKASAIRTTPTRTPPVEPQAASIRAVIPVPHAPAMLISEQK